MQEDGLSLVVELVHNRAIEGWGLDKERPHESLRVFVEHAGRVIATTEAGVFRDDLLHGGVGTGHHGFKACLSGTDWFAVLSEPDALRVYGTNSSGDRIDAHFYHTANIDALRLDFPYDGGTLRWIGESYLKDNLLKFGTTALADEHIAQPIVLAVSVKMQIFGDAWWWEDLPDGRVRSAASMLGLIDDALSRRIATGEVLLILDLSNEAPAAVRDSDWIAFLCAELERRAIAPDDVAWIVQNEAFESEIRAWTEERGLPCFHVLNYAYYPRRFTGLLAAAPNDDRATRIAAFRDRRSRRKIRSFVALNFTPRPERVAFVAWLAGSGLLARGFVSFGGFANRKLDNSARLVPAWYPDRELVEKGLPIIGALAPISVDPVFDNEDYTPEFDMPPEQIYHDSLFSIVTESECSNGDIARFTEKTLKPIANFHPFILIGNPGSLSLLRAWGFQTFAPHIDESYDEEVDPRRRLRLIHKEIRRLVELDGDEAADLLHRLEDRLIHNYLHIHAPLDDSYRHIVEPRIARDLFEIGVKHSALRGRETASSSGTG